MKNFDSMSRTLRSPPWRWLHGAATALWLLCAQVQAITAEEADLLAAANEAGEAGDFAAARAALDALERLPQPTRAARANAGMTRAWIRWQAGDNAGALTAYADLLDGRDLNSGQRTSVLYTAAQLAMLQDRYEDALAYYRRYRAYEEHPSGPRRVFEAQILYRLERYAEMIPPLRAAIDEVRAVDATPRSDWLRLLAFACEKASDAQCLEEILDELFVREPSEPAARRAAASFLELQDGERLARALSRHLDKYPHEGFTDALQIATATGDLHAVAARIRAGDELDQPLGLNRTPLMIAAWLGHEEIATALLEAGARVDAVNGNDETALAFAAFGSQPALVRLLWNAGADTETLGTYTPFQLMSRAGATDLALDLLDAWPHQLDSHGGQALAFAIMNGHTETVNALLERGADASFRHRNGRSLLESAAHEGNAEATEALLAAGAGTADAEALDQSLMIAATRADAVALQLLAAGADPESRADNGRTPLWLAAGWGQQRTVEKLVALGVELDLPDSSGRTPLQIAAQTGHGDAALALVRAGANFERRYEDGTSVLARAVAIRDRALTVALLEAGAAPDGGAAWANESSPMASAVHTGDPGFVDLLLQAGAILVPEGRRPHHHLLVAALREDVPMFERLLAAGLPLDGPVARFDGWDTRDLTRFLRRKGFARTDRDTAHQTWRLTAPVWQTDAEDIIFVLPRENRDLSAAEVLEQVVESGYGVEQWIEDTR